MKRFRTLVLWVDCVFSIIAAFLFFAIICRYPHWAFRIGVAFRNYAETSPRFLTSAIYVLIAFGLVNVAVLLWKIREVVCRIEAVLVFPRGEGRVAVRTKAIEGVLLRTAKSHAEVRNARVSVQPQQHPHRQVLVEAWVELEDVPNVPSALRELQQSMKARFEEIFRQEHPVVVDVTVTRLVSGEPPSPGRPEELQQGIERPRYTVEGI